MIAGQAEDWQGGQTHGALHFADECRGIQVVRMRDDNNSAAWDISFGLMEKDCLMAEEATNNVIF